MAYDWRGEVAVEPYSLAWFDIADARFHHGSRLFAHGGRPFDRLIPFDRLSGKRVLEIGCGMGLHTELMARAGAEVVSVDLTETAVNATAKRLALKGIEATVLHADAEDLPFETDSFDFIWSWGVVHHSARTGRIIREISRVARPTSEVRLMVYNRDGAPAWITLWARYLFGLGFLSRSLDDELNRTSDGFAARFYTRDQFEDLLRIFFDDVASQVLGQESDVVPLPRAGRRLVAGLLPESYFRKAQASRGAFIFAIARRQAAQGSRA